MKSLCFSEVSNSIWSLKIIILKFQIPITLSALSLIMISMRSLFECITHFSSLFLEDTNITAFVNWLFHKSDFFRSFFTLLGMV